MPLIAGVEGPLGDLGPCVVYVDSVEVGKTFGGVRTTYATGEQPVVEDQKGEDPVDHILTSQAVGVFIPLTRETMAKLSGITAGAAGSGTTGNQMTIRDVTGRSGYDNAVQVDLVKIESGDASASANDRLRLFKVNLMPNWDVTFDNATQRARGFEGHCYKVRQGEVHAGDIGVWGGN